MPDNDDFCSTNNMKHNMKRTAFLQLAIIADMRHVSKSKIGQQARVAG
jgi:hypothetical protein